MASGKGAVQTAAFAKRCEKDNLEQSMRDGRVEYSGCFNLPLEAVRAKV